MNAWEPGLTRDFWWHPYDNTLGEAVRASAKPPLRQRRVRARALREGARPLLSRPPHPAQAASRQNPLAVDGAGDQARRATPRIRRTGGARGRRARAAGEGYRLVVLGPNGAGKTTLLRILATLLRPTAARSRFSAARCPTRPGSCAAGIGYLGHEPLLYRDLTGRENLRFHAKLHGITGERAEARIEELLAAVKLSHRGDERTYEFSAGMRQRLAICRCVLHEPELLLLDEPDSNLDIEGREIAETLIGPGGGHTRVIVTHDPERFLPEADQVLRLGIDEATAVS